MHYLQCASQGALTEKLLESLKINGAAYICRNDQILARGIEKLISNSLLEAFNTEREKHAQTNLEILVSKEKTERSN